MAARVVLRDDGGLGSGGVGSHSTRLKCKISELNPVKLRRVFQHMRPRQPPTLRVSPGNKVLAPARQVIQFWHPRSGFGAVSVFERPI